MATSEGASSGSVGTCVPAGCAARSSRPSSRSCRCCMSGRRSPPRRTGSPCRRPAAQRQASICQQLLRAICAYCRPSRSARECMPCWTHVKRTRLTRQTSLRAAGGVAPAHALPQARLQVVDGPDGALVQVAHARQVPRRPARLPPARPGSQRVHLGRTPPSHGTKQKAVCHGHANDLCHPLNPSCNRPGRVCVFLFI